MVLDIFTAGWMWGPPLLFCVTSSGNKWLSGQEVCEEGEGLDTRRPDEWLLTHWQMLDNLSC